MSTSEEAVWEAREAVTLNLLEMEQASYSPALCERRRIIVEASVDALLTAERARLAARVEGMRDNEDVGNTHDEYLAKGNNAAVAAVLAMLREPA